MREDGLTAEEGLVMDHLISAAQAYARLPVQHPDEHREVVDAIHAAQNVLAVRVCRRCFSNGWPVKNPKTLVA